MRQHINNDWLYTSVCVYIVLMATLLVIFCGKLSLKWPQPRLNRCHAAHSARIRLKFSRECRQSVVDSSSSVICVKSSAASTTTRLFCSETGGRADARLRGEFFARLRRALPGVSEKARLRREKPLTPTLQYTRSITHAISARSSAVSEGGYLAHIEPGLHAVCQSRSSKDTCRPAIQLQHFVCVYFEARPTSARHWVCMTRF